MSYPELDQILRGLRSAATTVILTEDALIDSHGLFLVAYAVNTFLQAKTAVVLKSFRFRKFELEAVLVKAGITNTAALVKTGQLRIFGIESGDEDADFEAWAGPRATESESESDTALVLDGATALLERSRDSHQGLCRLVNLLIRCEAVFKAITIKSEFDRDDRLETQVAEFLKKRADILIQTEPTSFVSSTVHGRLMVRNEGGDVYRRLYHVKDRSLRLTALGSN